MNAGVSKIAFAIVLGCLPLGWPSLVHAAEMDSSFDVNASGTGTYTYRTNDPTQTPVSSQGSATLFASGSDYGGFLTTNLTIKINGSYAVGVTGIPGNGSGSYTLALSTLEVGANDSNYPPPFSGYKSGSASLKDLMYTIGSSTGYTIYNFHAGSGTADITYHFEQEVCDNNGCTTPYYYDTEATILISSLTGSYYLPSGVTPPPPLPIPLPPSAPLLGTGLVAFGMAGRLIRRRRGAA